MTAPCQSAYAGAGAGTERGARLCVRVCAQLGSLGGDAVKYATSFDEPETAKALSQTTFDTRWAKILGN